MALAASVLAGRPRLALSADLATGEVNRRPGIKLKIGLNSYSFNRPLMSGKMTLEDAIDYRAAHNRCEPRCR